MGGGWSAAAQGRHSAEPARAVSSLADTSPGAAPTALAATHDMYRSQLLTELGSFQGKAKGSYVAIARRVTELLRENVGLTDPSTSTYDTYFATECRRSYGPPDGR